MPTESSLKKPEIALIDGDILTYRLGFGGQKKLPDGTIEPIPDPVMKARVDSFIVDLLMFDLPSCTDYEGYLSLDSESNFRNAIAVTAPYKGNRTAAKPHHYDLIRERLLTYWDFHGIIGQEADDSLAQEQTEKGDKTVIVSIDKDMLQVPGWHYNFVTRNLQYVTMFGGFYNFCVQMLMGDKVDNIIGLKQVGIKTAQKILMEVDPWESSILTEVAAQYKKHGDTELKHFKENAKLLWLRRRKDYGEEYIDYLIKELGL
jgi:hypothetical protein